MTDVENALALLRLIASYDHQVKAQELLRGPPHDTQERLAAYGDCLGEVAKTDIQGWAWEAIRHLEATKEHKGSGGITPEHRKQVERVKEQAMRAFGQADGVTLEDALATMVLMLERHTGERNEALNINARLAGMLAEAWQAAAAAEKRAIELLQGMKGDGK